MLPAKHNINENSASLDRIDSSQGYIEGNVWWVHKIVNVIKLDFSFNELVQLCQMVVNGNKFKQWFRHLKIGVKK